eukprot:3911421-Prymnesium_polylepis.1
MRVRARFPGSGFGLVRLRSGFGRLASRAPARRQRVRSSSASARAEERARMRACVSLCCIRTTLRVQSVCVSCVSGAARGAARTVFGQHNKVDAAGHAAVGPLEIDRLAPLDLPQVVDGLQLGEGDGA